MNFIPFDLKQSLQREITWKMKKGPLRPNGSPLKKRGQGAQTQKRADKLQSAEKKSRKEQMDLARSKKALSAVKK